MFGQILSSNCLPNLKAPCGRKWTQRFADCWPMCLSVTMHASNSKSPTSRVLCPCSDIIIEFLPCPQKRSQIGVQNSLNAVSRLSPAPCSSPTILCVTGGGGDLKHSLILMKLVPEGSTCLSVEGLDTNLACVCGASWWRLGDSCFAWRASSV